MVNICCITICLPQRTTLSHCHYVRPRKHNKELIPKTRMLNNKDFIVRMLYKDMYYLLNTRLTAMHCIFNSILLYCLVCVAFDNVFNKRILLLLEGNSF